MQKRFLASALLLGAVLATLLPITWSVAQPRAGFSPTVTAAAALASPAPVKAGTSGVLTVTLTIKPGFHIYSAAPGSPDFIPTTVKGEKTDGVTWGKSQFPPAKSVTMAAISPTPVMVYENKAAVKLPYTITKTVKPGKHALKASVECQACNDKVCYPPQTLPVTAELTVR